MTQNPAIYTEDNAALRRFVDIKDSLAIAIVLFIALALGHAGGHIYAPATAIVGLIGILGHRLVWPQKAKMAWIIAALFFGYILLSSLWSPFEETRAFKNLHRFALGIPLYALFVLWMGDLGPRAKRLAITLTLILVPLSIIVYFIDIGSGFAITRLVDADAHDLNIEANLSHGLSAIILSLIPAAFLLWQKGGRVKFIAPILYIVTFITALLFGQAASVLALIFMAVIAALAAKWPRLAAICVIFSAIALLWGAPALGWLSSGFTPEQKAALPFSWEWRVETWGWIYAHMDGGWMFGHGFDSLRTITETFSTRGYDNLPIVSMHAHNIGLHLWYELGLFGIAFATLILALLWQAARKATLSPRFYAVTLMAAGALTFSALSYSPWSDWWLGAIAFGLGLCQLLPKYPRGHTG